MTELQGDRLKLVRFFKGYLAPKHHAKSDWKVLRFESSYLLESDFIKCADSSGIFLLLVRSFFFNFREIPEKSDFTGVKITPKYH